jgi:hypothetical protein
MALHALLVSLHHRCHIASEATVPVVADVGLGCFNHLADTCSEPGVIAKWFSWILFAVGDVRSEMASRLAKWSRVRGE